MCIRDSLAGAQPQFQHGGGRHDRIGQEHHTGMCLWGAERDGLSLIHI